MREFGLGPGVGTIGGADLHWFFRRNIWISLEWNIVREGMEYLWDMLGILRCIRGVKRLLS